MKLLEICIGTHFKTIGGYIYTQTDGTLIWKSKYGQIAGINLHWFERTYTYIFNENCECKPLFWKRMRADILIVWKQGTWNLTDLLISYGNQTKDKVYPGMRKNGILPFMDINILRENYILVTKVYRIQINRSVFF